jgi:hypothetical protein
MATMNPKTRSYGSKGLKGVKLPEDIPDVSGKISGNPCEKCSETVTDLMPKIKEETNFDNQIRYLRQFIKTLAEENHSSNCDKIQFVVFWFFELNQASSLRPIIASSLNKLGKDNHFAKAFDEAIMRMIFENDLKMMAIPKIIENNDLANKISRCFENCNPAFLGVKENINALYEIFSEKEDLGEVSRVILSLETIAKSPNQNLVKNLMRCFLMEDLQGELKSNLCLIWTYELKDTDCFVKNVVKGLNDDEENNPLKVKMPQLFHFYF